MPFASSNYVRFVRDLPRTNSWRFAFVGDTHTPLAYSAVNRYADSVGDGISDWWRAKNFGGSGATTNAASCAACDPDHGDVDALTDPSATGTQRFYRIGVALP